MSQLVKIETTNPFVVALQSPKFLDMKKPDAMNLLNEIINKTSYDAGQDIKQDTKAVCIAMFDEVKKYFPFIRSEELRIAFANGVRKEYGDFYGLNIVTFHSWIKAWQFDEKRKNALAAIKKSKEVEYAPVMTKDEAEYEYILTIKKQFREYKETGRLEILFPAMVFKDFEARGLINLSKEEKVAIFDKAKAKYEESLRIQRLNPKSADHLRALSSVISRIEKNEETNTDTAKIKGIACEMAIKKYYDSISELSI